MLLCITMQKKLSICLFTKDNTLKRMFMHNNNNNNAFGCSVYYSMIVNSSSSVSIFGIILCTSFLPLSYFAILYPYSIWCIAKSKSPNIKYLATAVVTLLHHLQWLVQFFVYIHVAEKESYFKYAWYVHS